MNCRHCKSPLLKSFLDLGSAPPSNAFLNIEDVNQPEKYFPLKIMFCTTCWLVQTKDYVKTDELFHSDYAYFSSTSRSWLDHAAAYSKSLIDKLKLDKDRLIIEVGSNDGYLLKNFLAAGIPCIGIEPTKSTSEVALKLGIPVLKDFFSEKLGKRLSSEGMKADVIICNNVFAHVPDINDFALGLKAALKPSGIISLEFPHLKKLIEYNQFDTIYHEHFSYLSLYTVERIFKFAGLRVWDVEELSTHGGSLRVYGCHENDTYQASKSLDKLRTTEAEYGLQTPTPYEKFQCKAHKIKNDLISFLIEQKKLGKTIAGYGAAAKGSTLINYAGIKSDLMPFICDASEAKQGKYMPGSHIPILPPGALSSGLWNFVVIFPWNIAEEIMEDNSALVDKGTKFVTAIPELRTL